MMSSARHACFPLNGTDLLDSFLSSTTFIKTGCASIDELLDGGVWTGEVTEVVGSVAVGKTQFCLLLCAQVCCNESTTALYLDTAANFSAERLCQIISKRQLIQKQADIESALCQVRCIRSFDIYSVLQHLSDLKTKLTERTDLFYRRLKLVVIDPISVLISPILGGQQFHGHSLMMELARILKVLATELGVAVLCTNGVISDKMGVSVKPALGKSWAHIADTRIFLQAVDRGEDERNKRQASLMKSSRNRTRGLFAFFDITSGGLVSATV